MSIFNSLTSRACALVAVLAFASATHALAVGQVITFEGHPDDFAGTQFQDGFRFDFNADGWGIFTDGFVGGGAPYTHNGTTRLMASGGNPTAYVDMTPVSGVPFALTGFDAATMFPDLGSGGIVVVGSLFGGGTVTENINVTTTFGAFILPATFTNLTSVRFSNAIPSDFRQDPSFSLDNIVIDGGNRVPDAGSVAPLFFVAVVGLIAFRRKSHFA
jgi:hypothetical protein